MKLLVYGTLKQGFGNNYLLSSAKFLNAVSISGFKMYSLGAFPMCVLGDTGDVITGECYEIDEHTLRQTDRLEGFPRFYDRKIVDATTEDGQTLSGWIYFGSPDYARGAKLVKTGTWERDTWNS
jgi:gamma-glutamylcyclotransferase (GGCT)/AIG2-like uncharacterized protein YtfP